MEGFENDGNTYALGIIRFLGDVGWVTGSGCKQERRKIGFLHR